MSHTHPALFVGGPLDGQRKFLAGSSLTHRVVVPGGKTTRARFHDAHIAPGRNAFFLEEIEYECVEAAHGHFLYALRGSKRPDVMARLIGGYHAEGKH